MKRNERIFKKMFKESGATASESDSDDEETEAERRRMNQQAYNKWVHKKESQRHDELNKRSLQPASSTNHNKVQCLGPLMMIGDTSRGAITREDNSKYMYAYKDYKKWSRASSAPVRKLSIDPETYEDWMDRVNLVTPEATKKETQRPKSTNRIQLKKKIEYHVWLAKADKQLAEDIRIRRKEEKQKKDFENWIQEIKDEVGTFDYWKKNKEAKLNEERRILRIKQDKQQRKEQEEREQKKALSKQIYLDWVLKKEMIMLQQEEQRLKEETNKLKQMKDVK